jgi:hypothetical protein
MRQNVYVSLFNSDMPGQEISRGESLCDLEFLKLFTFNNVGSWLEADVYLASESAFLNLNY